MALLAVAIAPGIFWLWYFLKRDRLRPEPRYLIRRVFLLGAVAGIAAAVVEVATFRSMILEIEASGWNTVLLATLIGVIEEGMKFAVVLLAVYRHAEFNELFDGIIYSVTASMGFATLENIGYVVSGGLQVGIMRALLSVPGHAFFASLMGYYVGIAKFAGRDEWRWLIQGLLFAALAHAVFDAVLLTQTAFALASVPLVAFLWRRAVVQSRRVLALDNLRAQGTPFDPGR